MLKNELTALIVVIILVLGLVVDVPIEFTTQPGHIIAVLMASAIVVWLFNRLLNPPTPFQKTVFNMAIRIASAGLVLCYGYVALFWIFSFSGINRYPRYKDLTRLENSQQEVAVKQECEISGSLYDYRNREVLAELPGGIRLSVALSNSELQRRWQRSSSR